MEFISSPILVIPSKNVILNTVYLSAILNVSVDARSMAFMRSYVEASYILEQESLRPLAAVDCYDWTDVCGKNNITSYPIIRIYRKGRDTLDYKGMLDASAIISTVKL